MRSLMKTSVKGTTAVFIATAAQALAHEYIGNSLNVPNGGVDGNPPFVILGEYSPAGPLATSSVTLPTGLVEDVSFYGGNYDFTLYALSLVGAGPNPNEQTFQVVASESFAGSAPVGIQTLAVSGFSVTAGDMLAFAGVGPYYSQNPDDALNSAATYEDWSNPGSYVATAPGGPGTQFSVGAFGDPNAPTYEYISDFGGNQGRNYGIGVSVPDSGSTLLMAAPIMAFLAAMKRRCSSKG
jgi:hypothetical protein